MFPWKTPAALATLCAVTACSHVETAGRSTSPDGLTRITPALLEHRLTPEELTAACEAAEKRADARLADLVALADAQRTFQNTFAAFEGIVVDYNDAAARLAFMKDVHPDGPVRAAGAACEQRQHQYLVALGARKDLYRAVRAARERIDLSTLEPAERRLVEFTLRDFRRNGLELSDADLKKLVALRTRIAELETKFESHLDENKDSVQVTLAELDGLPQDFIKRLARGANGQYVITMQYPDYYPFMESARNEAARKRVYLAFDTRAAEQNLPLLTEAVALRDQAAKLLGYASHVDFTTEPRMAKSAATVAAFLSRLRGNLKPGHESLLKAMGALKVQETHDPKARLEIWDWRYYLRELREKDSSVDEEEVRSYFPADVVVAGMFQVYAQLFHVAFREVPQADVWAPGVKLYEVHEAPDGPLLAQFYLDPFPRPGKYGHAAMFPLGAARRVPQGYLLPIEALVTNFNPPANGQPSMLSMREVETLFHEFGHIMHGALTTARFGSQSGANTSLDFVEAPSQMLENWIYSPEVLKLISRDPKDASKPMPAALAQRIAKARTFDAGFVYMRQVYLATLDFSLHDGRTQVDPSALEHQLFADIVELQPDPAARAVASFGHLMGGYDGGYYGYLWSKVFAADMFTRFEAAGVLDAATGLAYRDIILASGDTEDADALLRRFLGRAPNDQAFLRQMNVAP